MTYQSTEQLIWVLGSKSVNADRSIDWYEECPNLTNCDTLIVNLDSLLRLDTQRAIMSFYEVRKYIFHLMMTGKKTVIFILPTSFEGILSYLHDIMPIVPIFKAVARCEFDKIDYSKDLDKGMTEALTDYLKTVRDCNYYISSLDTRLFWEKIDPDSSLREIYYYTPEINNFVIQKFSAVLNKAAQNIGESFRIYIHDEQYTNLFATGFIHILPPPTEISAEEGIEVIINHLIGLELKEPSPKWVQEIKVPGLDEVMSKINQLNIEVEEITKQREDFEKKRDRLEKFRRLLWTKGEEILQEAVKNAFVELGFTEIRQERAKNKEDWILDFKSKPLIGVLEVTGADKRTSLKDLRKCADWVTDYDEKGRECKGIFIPNQYRREEYPKSKKKREHFERNEIQFAKKHNICILPSHMRARIP